MMSGLIAGSQTKWFGWRSGANLLKKREITCGAIELLEVANMGIKMIPYVLTMAPARFEVDTGSTSGFPQKTFSGFFEKKSSQITLSAIHH